ncbi:MAG TPA: bifunctional isocitrate dehydrogenase kinase/phosphatase [Paenalcaligenes sp.]|nr:bifunctional isocitrate dehydrogenase kinase/phosphatase [Paenalcaligenes sp.]
MSRLNDLAVVIPAQRAPSPEHIAQTILDGFNRHYSLFRYSAQRAKVLFESGLWNNIQQLSSERIEYYDIRVRECTTVVSKALRNSYLQPNHTTGDIQLSREQEDFWRQVKANYVRLLNNHKQPECAETFFNSVSCRVLHRTYFNNDFIFVRPAVATEYIGGSSKPAYRAYYPLNTGLLPALHRMVADFGLAAPFVDLPADIRLLARRAVHKLRQRLPYEPGRRIGPDCQIQVLNSLFFRNKGAYIVGRFINYGTIYPFAIALTHTQSGHIEIDALLDDKDDLSTLFSFTRAYFLVDMEIPAAYVGFLKSLLPRKPEAEFYNAIGLQKQGKTLFYRDFLHHLHHSNDLFQRADGIEGMVMVVFTLPSYPYVFKVIRDKIRKENMSHKIVKDRYLLVKKHDRAGRMADTWEYSQVALPKARFSAELLAELRAEIPSLLEESQDHIVLKHVYIERRMLPLNIYLSNANDSELAQAVKQYGEAIRELAANNIFPGDMLFKNFGLTRLGRLVFYDYDEIQTMTEMNFRVIPEPPNAEAEMASEPWYPVAANDVFPEEFEWFLLGDPRIRDAFKKYHPELLTAQWWSDCRQRVSQGRLENIYPYSLSKRLPARRADSLTTTQENHNV